MLSWALAITGVVTTLAVYPFLPETIPTHFGVRGQADAYGPSWTILPLAALWLAMQALLAVFSHYPRVFNYPVPVTEENAQRLYREGERMLVWLALAQAPVFGGLLIEIAAGGEASPGAGLAITAACLLGMFGVMIVGIVRTLRAADPIPQNR